MGQRDGARSFLPGLPVCPRVVTGGCPAQPCLPLPTWQLVQAPRGVWDYKQAVLEGRRNFDELNCPTAASDMPEKEKISHEVLAPPGEGELTEQFNPVEGNSEPWCSMLSSRWSSGWELAALSPLGHPCGEMLRVSPQ